jgi:hypothetical protein
MIIIIGRNDVSSIITIINSNYCEILSTTILVTVQEGFSFFIISFIFLFSII